MIKKKCVLIWILVAALLAVSGGPASASEDADTPPAGEKAIVLFEFTRGGYLPPQSIALCLEGDGYRLARDGDWELMVDPSVAGELLSIIETYGVEAWDGFHGTDPNVLDGEGFRLYIQFSDGSAVSASGDNAFPENYFSAAGEMELLLNGAAVCGVYRYEGEGFGGDFTITLEKDGTYSFYEGHLSSYMGGGLWFLDGSLLYLVEQNGLELNNDFLFTEGALVFLEDYSDNFPYVRVPDGGRFLRTELPEEPAPSGGEAEGSQQNGGNEP